MTCQDRGQQSNATMPGVRLSNDKRRSPKIRFNDDPERASRPFDKERDGFVLAGKVLHQPILAEHPPPPARLLTLLLWW